jgi:hypothetical protein
MGIASQLDDVFRLGGKVAKGAAGSVDDIASKVDDLIRRGLDPDSVLEAKTQWEKGNLNYTPSDPRLGSKKGGLLLGDDIHTQHPSVEAMDARTASDKARNSILRKDNPIFNPDEVRLDEPVAKRYESSIRDENLELSNRGRTKLEEKAFRKSQSLAQAGPFKHHHILDLEFTGKLLNRIDSDEIVKELRRFGIDLGDRSKNIIGAMDQKTADFRLSAQDDIAKQLGAVDYKAVKGTEKSRIIEDLLKNPKDTGVGKELAKGTRNKLTGEITPPEIRRIEGDYAIPTDPASYGLPRGKAIAGKRFGYKLAKHWPDGRKVTKQDLINAYQNRWKYNGIDRSKVKFNPQGQILSKDHIEIIHYAGYNSPQFIAKRNVEAMVTSGEWRRLSPKQAAAKIAEVYQIKKNIILNVSKKRLRLVKAHLNKSEQGKFIIRQGPHAIRDWIIKNKAVAANLGWKQRPPTFKWLAKDPGPITEELRIVFATELEPFLDLTTFAQTFTSQL